LFQYNLPISEPPFCFISNLLSTCAGSHEPAWRRKSPLTSSDPIVKPQSLIHQSRMARPLPHKLSRRYSWPPTLHLIDLSAIPIPLPDINDDPFAHFVSKPPPEEDVQQDIDNALERAGVDPRSRSYRDEALRFSTLISLRWERGRAVSEEKFPDISPKRLEQLNTPVKQTFLSPDYARGRRRPARNRHSWHAPSEQLYTIREE